MRGLKESNEYVASLSPHVYAETPKAVFAAIALSYFINGDCPHTFEAQLLKEWKALYDNGIVSQPLPKKFQKLIDVAEEKTTHTYDTDEDNYG